MRKITKTLYKWFCKTISNTVQCNWLTIPYSEARLLTFFLAIILRRKTGTRIWPFKMTKTNIFVPKEQNIKLSYVSNEDYFSNLTWIFSFWEVMLLMREWPKRSAKNGNKQVARSCIRAVSIGYLNPNTVRLLTVR